MKWWGVILAMQVRVQHHRHPDDPLPEVSYSFLVRTHSQAALIRAKVQTTIDQLDEDIRYSSDADYALHLSKIHVDGFTFLSEVNSRNFFRYLKAGLPSTFVPTAALRDSHGALVQTYSDNRQIVRQQFGNLLGGTPKSLADVLDSLRIFGRDHSDVPCPVWDLSAVPTFARVAHKFAHVNLYRT